MMRLYRLSLAVFGLALAAGQEEDRGLTESASLTNVFSDSSQLSGAFKPIVGGQQASSGQFPFFVQGNGCGGTLVWQDIVLTAAHCNGRFNDQVLVSAEVKNVAQGASVFKKTLSSMVFHPKNQPGTYIYDFMMFKIEPVDGFEGKVMQTNGNRGTPVTGEQLTVIGMGYTQEGGPSSMVLNYVDVLAYSDSQCQASYGNSIIPEAMLCAGWPQGGKDSCNGDSGSPLFNSAGQQVGLTSFGSGCARANRPGVYARISAAKDWIDQTICSLSANPPSSCFSVAAPTPRQPVPPPVLPPTTRAPTPQPTFTYTDQSVSISSTTTYRITVQYDSNPNEMRWVIRGGGTKIMEYDYFSGVPALGTVTEFLPLQSGRRYTLVVRDRGGDGFCCADGPGKIDIIATVNGVDQSLLSMLGDIGWYKRITFIAP